MIKYTYCPYCRGKLSFRDGYFRCLICKKPTFVGSSPAVAVLPVKNGKVLLAKRGIEPHKGAWNSIGGFMKQGESPESAARREMEEETGLKIKLKKILGIYPDTYDYQKEIYEIIVIHYLAEISGGELKADSDVASLAWYEIDKLKPRVGFRNFNAALRDLKKWYRSSRGAGN